MREHFGVAIAQVVEHWNVDPRAVSSNLTGHPEVFLTFLILITINGKNDDY